MENAPLFLIVCVVIGGVLCALYKIAIKTLRWILQPLIDYFESNRLTKDDD